MFMCSHVLRRQLALSTSERVHHSTTSAARLSHRASWSSVLRRRVGRLPARWCDAEWSCSGQCWPRGRPRHGGLTSRGVLRRRPALALRLRGPGSVRHPTGAGWCVRVTGNVAGRVRRAEHRLWISSGCSIRRGSRGVVERLDCFVPRMSAFSGTQRRRYSYCSSSTEHHITGDRCQVEQVRVENAPWFQKRNILCSDIFVVWNRFRYGSHCRYVTVITTKCNTSREKLT